MKVFRFISSFLLLLFLLGITIPNFLKPNIVRALPQSFFKTEVASGFNEPTDFVETPDGKILVIEKSGNIKIVSNGVVSNFTNSPIAVNQQGERGLLGITLDPNYQQNRFIYIFYVNNNPLEYHLSRITESNGTMAAGSEVILYKTATNPNGKTHIGGGLRFGSDGKLWFTIGDNTLNVEKEPQKLTSPYGKLHRVNIDGSIPSDNPFFGQTDKVQSIFAYGLRNPFKFDFRGDGVAFVADVGGDFFEEVDLISSGGNFGWPDCEGVCSTPGFINPIYQYGHGPNGASITGGAFYNGNNFPSEFKNDYFFGDYVNGFIKRLDFDSNGNFIEKSFDDNAGTVVAIREGRDGSIYFLNIFPGSLQKIYYSEDNQAPTAKISANPISGDPPLKVQFSSQGSFDPENSPLLYEWDFGDGVKSSEQDPEHIYTDAGKYTATLIVSDGQLKSQLASIDIQVGNLQPEILYFKPSEGLKYNAGDVIQFSANVKDREDGDLAPGAFVWKIIFHHETHTHPYGDFSGVKSGQFTINDSVERSADTFYEVQLTVADSSGLKTVKSANVFPNKVSLNINSSVPNMVAKLNGIPYAIPYNTEAVVNFKLTVEAVSPLIRDGKEYEFVSWFDGGAQLHVITIPNSDYTLTVNYQEISKTIQRVEKFGVVAGDIKVNGQALYDDDSSTGLAVLFEEAADIETPWGASVIPNSDLASAEVTLKQVVEDMKLRGCGGSCSSVEVIYFPKDVPPPSFEMTAGETKTVSKYSVILGDVKVSGNPLYDSDENSGLITILETEGEVFSEWGATVLGNKDMASAEAKAAKFAEQLKQTGCGGGCGSVKVLKWPSLN